MSVFTVDSEKCKRDGICVSTCPRSIIVMEGDDSVPVPSDNADDQCINCGHCVAICPHGAITLKTMRPDECIPVIKEWRLGSEQIEHYFGLRRSIRSYKEEAVPRDILMKLIDIARFAPTGHNAQHVKWAVFYEDGEVRRLVEFVIEWMQNTLKEKPEVGISLNMNRKVDHWQAGSDTLCWSAPHLIMTYTETDRRFGEVDCATALAHIELVAPSFGLGTCWSGYLTAAAKSWPPLQEYLGLPEKCACTGAVMIGYPKYTYQRLPLRNEAQITWR